MTLNGQNALCRRKDASFGAHCTNLIKIDPYYRRPKCRPMILVSGNIKFMGIFAGVPLGGASNEVGLSTTALFGDLCGYFFENVRNKTSNITWRHATPCLPVIDCKMNDLARMTLSANFTSKSVFDHQGCRALTFALARLSCLSGGSLVGL